YFYLYHCYFGQKNVEKAKAILMQGLTKYPGNSRIVEGLLAIYTSGEGDPKEVIPLVEKAIQNDPKNAGLYSGLGLVQDKLGNVDASIAAFAKAAELSPKDYSANFNLGLLYIKQGDKMNADFSKKVFPTREEYDAALAGANKVYGEAIAPLERALSLKNGDPSAIELLKNLSFRLRDEPGMMDKYNKYNEMFKALPPQEAAPAPAAQ
ncbi:MAG: hypothetical protein LBU95_01135, partial [Rikenellaceae bacterium]|nr:hypothetical protein [Rikenellaceae bacterium]